MIIEKFFKVNSNEIVIFKVNFKFQYEKFKVFVTFYKNLHTRLLSRSRAKKLRLRLQQKVTAPPALATVELEHAKFKMPRNANKKDSF
jgi:hypothetical protein